MNRTWQTCRREGGGEGGKERDGKGVCVCVSVSLSVCLCLCLHKTERREGAGGGEGGKERGPTCLYCAVFSKPIPRAAWFARAESSGRASMTRNFSRRRPSIPT